MSKESTHRSCCATFRGWKHRRIFCFTFAGIMVLAVILLSVLLTVGRDKQSKGGSAMDALAGTTVGMPFPQGAPYKSSLADGGEPYPGGDEFANLTVNGIQHVCDAPISTFSADVDTASYSYCRRMLNLGSLPNTDAVRTEEMINYFDYDYPLPTSKDKPFEPTVSISDSPWNEGRKILHIGIKGFDIEPSERRPSNLVFLLDVSGSMAGNDRLPLVKTSIELLLNALDPQQDKISIVTYSGGVEVVLGPTFVHEKDIILNAVYGLEAGGGTSGAGGLAVAYDLAEENFNENGINRIILATDGDFNIGTTDNNELQRFVSEKREKGIFLSVLGFGYGNYKDSRMKALANNGNGVAAYIDTIHEAEKVLVTEAQATLFPIAKDVKFQVVFNPAEVSGYRLIGYEKRLLQQEDFDDDTVDAGEIGSGHTVTVIYELDPAVGLNSSNISGLCDATNTHLTEQGLFSEFQGVLDVLAFLKIRYKLPDEDASKIISRPITKSDDRWAESDIEGSTTSQSLRGFLDNQVPSNTSLSVYREFDFATAVAGFAQKLQGGEYIGSYSYEDIVALAESTKGDDAHSYRSEFIQLVKKARQMQQ